MTASTSLSWNLLGNKVAMGLMVAGAVVWLFYCSFQDSTENIKNGKKKDPKKVQEPLQEKHSKNDDRKGVSPDDLGAALEKKVTKDGDCISCRELPSTPKTKTTTIPVPQGTPALPGLDSTFNTPKVADTSLGSTNSANSSWDKLSLPPTPKKKFRDVPPTPSNSLTIMLKNKKKKEPTSEGETISSSDKSDKEMEKTQDDL